MRRFSSVAVIVASLLVAPAPAIAQGSGNEASPWEFGAGIGVGINESTEVFEAPLDACGPDGVLPSLSLSARYSVSFWLDVGLRSSHHQDFSRHCPVATPDVGRGPGTYTDREYPERLLGGADYFSTAGRVVIEPFRRLEGVRPFFVAGVGRIWGKEVNYPEFGIGAAMPVGALTLQAEAFVRRLSVSYDSVTTRVTQEFEIIELSRVRLDEDHFPFLFRLGVGWRP